MLIPRLAMAFVLPRPSRRISFSDATLGGEGAFAERVDDLADETVTKVVRPGMKRLEPPMKRTRPRTPPRAMTSTEADLPSVMVAQESWVPPPPPSGNVYVPFLKMRWETFILGLLAIALGAAGLRMIPILGAFVDGAFSVLNR